MSVMRDIRPPIREGALVFHKSNLGSSDESKNYIIAKHDDMLHRGYYLFEVDLWYSTGGLLPDYENPDEAPARFIYRDKFGNFVVYLMSAFTLGYSGSGPLDLSKALDHMGVIYKEAHIFTKRAARKSDKIIHLMSYITPSNKVVLYPVLD